MTAFKIHSDLATKSTAIDERVLWFYQRFQKLYRNDAHFTLACHAAFPIALTSDLLYHIWINFQQHAIKEGDASTFVPIPYEAVSDILLSSLCKEVRPELFEMDKPVRDYLLENLREHSAFGDQRLKQLAQFLISYSKATFTKSYEKTLAQSQHVTALAYLNPELAAQGIIDTMNQLSAQQEGAELGRVSDLVETLEMPLAQIPELVNYSKALGAELRGNSNKAQQLLANLEVREAVIDDQEAEVIEVAGTTLYVNDRLRHLVRKKLQDTVSNQPPEEIVGATTYWDEAKVMFVGPEGAGKTALVKQFSGQALSYNESSTVKTEIHRSSFSTHPYGRSSTSFMINIWDLGEKERSLQTDRLFYTPNTLYVLPFRYDKHSSYDIAHWLTRVSLLSQNAPILLLQHEFTTEKHESIDLPPLKKQFPNLINLIQVNAASGKGIKAMRKQIQHHAEHLSFLKRKIPMSWLEVKRSFSADQLVTQIEYKELVDRCASFGITDEKHIKQLIFDLQNLGNIAFMQGDLAYPDSIFTRPEKMTRAIHKLLDTEEVQARGRFFRGQLASIGLTDFNDDLIAQVIRIMKALHICFELDPNTFIVPNLLTEEAVDWPIEATEKQLIYRFVYSYNFPRVFPELLAKMKEYIWEERMWRTGALFRLNETIAHINEYEKPGGKGLLIQLNGPESLDLLYIIKQQLDSVHKNYPGISYREQVPCQCDACKDSPKAYTYHLSSLEKLVENGDHNVVCGSSAQWASISEVLDIAHFIPFDLVIERVTGLMKESKIIEAVKLLVDSQHIKQFPDLNRAFLLYYANLNKLENQKENEEITQAEYFSQLTKLRELVATDIEKLIREKDAERNPPESTPLSGEDTPQGYQFLDQDSIFAMTMINGDFRKGEAVIDSLLIFSTKKQQSWLVATNQRIFFFLDSETTIEKRNFLQWNMSLEEAQSPIRAKYKPDSKNTGLLDIGKRRNWLYSRKLFPQREDLESAIGRLVKDSQAQPSYQGPVDLLIMPSSQYEVGALLTRLSDIEEFEQSDATSYIVGRISTHSESLNIAILSPTGFLDIARQGARAISYFQPKSVFFINLATGERGNHKIGDLVVVRKSFVFEDPTTTEPILMDYDSELIQEAEKVQESNRWQREFNNRSINVRFENSVSKNGSIQASDFNYANFIESDSFILYSLQQHFTNASFFNLQAISGWRNDTQENIPDNQLVASATAAAAFAISMIASLGGEEDTPEAPQQSNIVENIPNIEPNATESEVEANASKPEVLSSIYGKINKLFFVYRRQESIQFMLLLRELLDKLPQYIQLVIWANTEDAKNDLAEQLQEWSIDFYIREQEDQSALAPDNRVRCYIINDRLGLPNDGDHFWIQDAFLVQKDTSQEQITLIETFPFGVRPNGNLIANLAKTKYVDLNSKHPWLRAHASNILKGDDFSFIGKDSYNDIVDNMYEGGISETPKEINDEGRSLTRNAFFHLFNTKRLFPIGLNERIQNSFQPFPNIDQFLALGGKDQIGRNAIVLAQLVPLEKREALEVFTEEKNKILDDIANNLSRLDRFSVIRNSVPVYEHNKQIICAYYNNCLVEIINERNKNVYLPFFSDSDSRFESFDKQNRAVWYQLGFNTIPIKQLMIYNNLGGGLRSLAKCLDRGEWNDIA